MNDDVSSGVPHSYQSILDDSRAIGFSMASDLRTGSLLKTLASSKAGGEFLELGTGTGLATAWLLDGMGKSSTLTSVDNDEQLLQIARKYLSSDQRLSLIHMDGGAWITSNRDKKFDFIFADTWHGKYLLLDEVLSMLKPGGIYLIDDMNPQPNWPDGHHAKAEALLTYLNSRSDLALTRLNWSTGIVVAVKQ